MNLFPEKRLTNRRIALHVFLLTGLIAIIVIAMTWPTWGAKLNNWAEGKRIEKLHSAMEACEDSSRCLGGYITHKFDETIVRIGNCGKTCGRYEADVEDLKYYFKCCGPSMDDKIYAIALPDHKKWRGLAVKYAQQFVDPSQRQP
jgi:hypothetical protein